MVVEFYNTKSDLKEVPKALRLLERRDCQIVDEMDILEPTILLNNNVTGSGTGNYVYIPRFERYYFVDNKKSINNGMIRFGLKVDVLQTYFSQLKERVFLLGRQEYIFNDMISDNRVPCEIAQQIDCIDLGKIFDKYYYYVTTTGGE